MLEAVLTLNLAFKHIYLAKDPPVRIKEVRRQVSPFIEDAVTLEYMSLHGIDKVRGGSYVSLILDYDTVADITRKIRGARNECLKCGMTGHFISSCPNKEEKMLRTLCSRCGRNNHIREQCYAKTYLNGESIKDEKSKVALDSDEEKEESSSSFSSSEDSISVNKEAPERSEAVSSQLTKKRPNVADSTHSSATIPVARLFNLERDADPVGKKLSSPVPSMAPSTVDKSSETKQSLYCTRCGRFSHKARHCSATHTIEGKLIHEDCCIIM